VDHFLSEVMPYEWTGRLYGSFTEKVFKIAGHLAFDPSKAFGVGSADRFPNDSSPAISADRSFGCGRIVETAVVLLFLATC
jgi:hypothetical protein